MYVMMSGSPLPSHRHTETEKVRSKPTIAAVLLVTKRCMRKIKACTFYETILTTSLLTYLSNTFNIDFLRGEKIFKKFNEKFVAYIKIIRKTAACLRWGEITEKMIADTNYCLRGERDSGRDPRGRPSLLLLSFITVDKNPTVVCKVCCWSNRIDETNGSHGEHDSTRV